MKQANCRKGFLTVDLMIALVLVVSIALIATPNFRGQIQRVDGIKVEEDIQAIENAIELYYLDNDKYPVDCDKEIVNVGPTEKKFFNIFEDIKKYIYNLNNGLGNYVITSDGLVFNKDQINKDSIAKRYAEADRLNSVCPGDTTNEENLPPDPNTKPESGLKVNPKTPDPPQVLEIGSDRRNVVTIDGGVGTEVKLGINGAWFSSPHTFTNLEVGKNYQTYSRLKANGVYFASELSQGVTFRIPVNERLSLSDIPVGSVVYDPGWLWEYRNGNRYTGKGEKRVVEWTIVAKNHTGYPANSITLISNNVIGKQVFDDNGNQGSNHWGNSGTGRATVGIRPWLNNVFYNSFSNDFKSQVMITNLLNVAPGREFYNTQDKVFIPSLNELGLSYHRASEVGKIYEYFNNGGSTIIDENYWTRSPISNSDFKVTFIGRWGVNDDKADEGSIGVRPVINMKPDTFVIEDENGKYKIEY